MSTSPYSLMRLAEPTPLAIIKASLADSCGEGDLDKVISILHNWRSDSSLPAPTPEDLDWPLIRAVSHGQISVVRLLLDQDAPIDASTVIIATSDDKDNTLAIFEAFREHGWNVECVIDDRSKDLAMNHIMENEDAETLVQWFLSHGASPNGLASDPGSPLRSAPTVAIASLLLSKGATLKNTSALHAAADYPDETKSLARMDFLLNNGIDINEREFEGRPVPRRSSRVRDHGTALYAAAEYGEISRVRLLVERGADVALKSRFGHTARDIALLYGKEDIKEYLEKVMRERGIEIKDVEVPEEGRTRRRPS